MESKRNGFLPKWWHDSVVYEIYIRSFADSNEDGIGDINGIISKLDYLKDLGIGAIWITPFYPSPMFDCGYDISDYVSIAPEYGTLDDFEQLITEAHKRGIKVILDMVLNHTSDEHKWFLDAKKSKDSKYRDYYVWAKGKNGEKPNNWYSIFGGSSWEYNKETGDYYYHAFFPQQPDLNWHNENLRNEMYNILRFWLDKGVDGFRLDAINFLMEDEQLRNNPGEGIEQEHVYDRDQEKTHEILKEIRKILDEYDDRMLVGEVYPGAPGQSQKYYGNGNDELHLAFNFLMLKLAQNNKFNAENLRKEMQIWDNSIKQVGWPTVVMSNHDQPRIYNSFGTYVSKKYRDKMAKLIATYILTSKGTPFIYYGDEIGMENYFVENPNDFTDNSGLWLYKYLTEEQGLTHEEAITKANEWGRDKCRTPMQWDSSKNAGFTTSDITWISVNPNYKNKNVEIQQKDFDSLLNHYKTLIKIRKEKEALRAGDYVWIDNGSEDYIAYIRKENNESILVILNLSEKNIQIDLGEHELLKNKIYNCLISNYKEAVMSNNNIHIRPVEAIVVEIN